jgi:hypothetical protein
MRAVAALAPAFVILLNEELLCAYLARELKSPVKRWESRSESQFIAEIFPILTGVCVS